MVSRLCLLLILIFGPSLPAHANPWLRAESDHYIVHAQMEDSELRALMQQLAEDASPLTPALPGAVASA